MSLHAAAQHLSSRGRGPDNTLVHMSRGEVKSLNDLAMAHGGQLTINPDTGLPEAGFLSKLLPMIAGAALAATGVGAPMAALLVGGGATAMTGSLKKGLMAGLGAYGGAGLGSSLMGAGAGATEAAASAIPEAAGSAASANPLAGLDMSGATTAGISPTAAAAPTATTGAGPLAGLDVSGATTAGVNPTTIAQTAPSVGSTVSGPAGFPGTATAQPNLATTNMEGHMYGGKPYTPFEEGFQGTAPKPTFSDNMASMGRGATGENVMDWAQKNPYSAYGMAASVLVPDDKETPGYKGDADMGQRYSYSADPTNPLPTPDSGGREQTYFTPRYTKISNEEAKSIYGFAGGGPVEQMSNANAIGTNTGYPMADITKGAYATPYQQPISRNVLTGVTDTGVNPMTGEMSNFASGGLSSAASHLGDYSDGGRLLKGPGDGVSDSIPAMIGKKQPARLADGEFVVPARIVSELGNGSTEAGARQLYAMLDRVQAARKKSIGKGKVAKNSRADKLLPA